MKFLKYLLITLGILATILILLGLVGPKTFDIHRSAIVSGTPEQVWPYVSSLQNMDLWSPWSEKDTNMILEFSGKEGTVGSSSSWSGNKDVGKGSQTITLLEPHSYVESQLKFMEPMEDEAKGYVRLADTTGGTFVTYGISGENTFMGKIFTATGLFDMMMGKDFERGMMKLTELMASAPKMESTGMKITEGEYPGGNYLAARGSMTFDQIGDFYGKNLPLIMAAIEKSDGQMAGAPSGLYYDWNMEKGTTDMAAAIAYTGTIKPPAGLEIISLPAAKSLTIDYLGNYDQIGSAHEAMEKYINDKKLEALTPAVEAYLTDPMTEPDTAKWLTRVMYFVK